MLCKYKFYKMVSKDQKSSLITLLQKSVLIIYFQSIDLIVTKATEHSSKHSKKLFNKLSETLKNEQNIKIYRRK